MIQTSVAAASAASAANGASPRTSEVAYEQGMVVTRTPLRVSFAGGGTDLADFYERDFGAVFSTAIDKYVYVTVKRHSEVFLEPIRINYSKTEQVNSIEEIENDIARATLNLLEIEPPIYVSTVADLPAATGLGGSSAFAVGLLHALHAYKGERVSPGQLAEEASHIEIQVLGQPIGKQDQYAAAFGGLNLFRFHPGGAVTVEPQRVSKAALEDLFRNVMMFWTGMQRNAGAVLEGQKKNTAAKIQCLNQMRNHALRLQKIMSNGGVDAARFGGVLDESWHLKRSLSEGISTGLIDAWYERGMAAGAEGGKICGAGGGGFLLFMVKPERQAAVRAALSDLRQVPVHPEVHGSRVLLPFPR